MGYYQLLGGPIPSIEEYPALLNYQGLYRDSPYINLDDNHDVELEEYFLWYYEYRDTIGIGETEYDKLKEFWTILRNHDLEFTMIYFDTAQSNHENLMFIGCDVAFYGRYSLLGDGFLELSIDDEDEFHLYVKHQNNYYLQQLNSRYLFDEFETAIGFKRYLEELNKMQPNYIETCTWDVYFVYRVMNT